MILDIMTIVRGEMMLRIKRVVERALAGNFADMVEMMVLLCTASVVVLAVVSEATDMVRLSVMA